MDPVMRVDNAIPYLHEVDGPNYRRLHLSAQGTVPTSGWSSPRLTARIYIEPPADGIQDFDFVAAPPTGPALEVLSPIATSIATMVESWFRGVRIHAKHNTLEPGVVPGEPTP